MVCHQAWDWHPHHHCLKHAAAALESSMPEVVLQVNLGRNTLFNKVHIFMYAMIIDVSMYACAKRLEVTITL